MPPSPAASSTARIAAWGYIAFGVFALLAGSAAFVEVALGPEGTGCKGMVQELFGGLALAVGIVVGIPHLVAPLWFLRRRRRGRALFLGLIGFNALADLAYAIAFAVHGPRAGLVLWVALLAVNLAAFVIVWRGSSSGR